jgi:hypothetical protein
LQSARPEIVEEGGFQILRLHLTADDNRRVEDNRIR